MERSLPVNGNRNRYTSAPLYGIKNKKVVAKPQPEAAPQQNVPQQNPQQGPYAQVPYVQPQAPYGYPAQGGYQQPNPGYAGYQQNTYGQQQPNPGYAPQPQGYGQNQYTQQAYGPNGQPVYGQPQAAPQQTPAAAPVHAQAGRRFGWLIGVVSIVLPILFILSLIFSNLILRIAFLTCAAAALLCMWLGKAFGKSARYTLTLIYAALIVVIGVTLVLSLPGPESQQVSGQNQLDPATLFGGSRALDSQSASAMQEPDAGNPEGSSPDFTVTEPEAVTPTSPAEIQLNAFMSYWAESQLDSMVGLCLPSWADNLENPKSELFILLANRTPLSYTVEKVSGSDADSSRTITLTVLIDKKSTSEPAYYQMQVLMLRVNENWYVDPNSLGATKLATTPVPGSTDEASIPFVPTATPAPTDDPAAIAILYYNSDGGRYYHADQYCSSVDQAYLPLTPFNYSDLNNTTFKNLFACTKCDAPSRPLITGN